MWEGEGRIQNRGERVGILQPGRGAEGSDLLSFTFYLAAHVSGEHFARTRLSWDAVYAGVAPAATNLAGVPDRDQTGWGLGGQACIGDTF